ncbi:MAG TPA: recombinase family protein [Candidatus Saccharimonadales bacterium]|nr:recombinase family protein [Candidatus Saccharimonadales bacterium]
MTKADAIYSNAVLYLRVSTKEQAHKGGEAEGYSIPAQRAACMHKAESLRAKVVSEFIDAGESAKTSMRPQLQAMLARLKKGDINYVIVHKVDRLARNRLDDATINLAIVNSGARLVSVSENIDETPSGKLVHGVMSSVAEFFSNNLANEVTKGMIQKLRAGGTVSKVPVGYLNITRFIDGKAIKTVVVDPERAPLVQEAFELYATGRYSLNTIADIFEAKGLTYSQSVSKAGGAITANHWHRLFRKRYYIGKIIWQGVEYQGSHTPLIDEETFEKVQETMKQHANSGERAYRSTHYLKGSLRCARCGGRITFSVSTKKGVKKPYFFCLSRHERRAKCTLPYVQPQLVEEKIIKKYLTEEPISPEEMIELKRHIMDDLAKYGQTSASERAKLKARIKTITEERYKWADKAMNGSVPDDIAKEKQATLAKQLKCAQKELASYELSIQDARIGIDRMCDLATRCGEIYATATPSLKQTLNQSLYECFEVEVVSNETELNEPTVYMRRKPFFEALKTAHFVGNQTSGLAQKEKRRDDFGVYSILNGSRVSTLVNPTTTQVETFFGELEYIEQRLKALGVVLADEEVDHV